MAPPSGGKKKKRRRRKDAPVPTTQDEAPVESLDFELDDSMSDDDLPSFDLDEEIDATSPVADEDMPAFGEVVSVSSDPLLREAMKGSAGAAGGGSIKEVLRSRDRNLENAFEFDDVAAPLPKAGEFMSSPSETGGVGKKRAKSDARRAAAIEAEEVAKGEESILEKIQKLPFPGKKEGEDEKLTPVKLLEKGTWACIYILIAWEFYINSPLFERAGEQIPVVFELLI